MKPNRKITLKLDTFFKIRCLDFFRALGCEVQTELELLKQPKRLDVLIIKKPMANQKVQKQFRILDYFRNYNLVGYKSFRDRFGISDIRDAIVYLQLFLNFEKAANEKNTTMTIITSQKPLQFLQDNQALINKHINIFCEGHYIIDYNVFKLHILNIEEPYLHESIDMKALMELLYRDLQKK